MRQSAQCSHFQKGLKEHFTLQGIEFPEEQSFRLHVEQKLKVLQIGRNRGQHLNRVTSSGFILLVLCF